MAALLIGYARVSTDAQDLTAQREGLLALGVDPSRIYVDHGLTGTNCERPGLREALAACREGDTLVVTKLDRLARSLPDARAIAEELTVRQVRLSLGGSVYDPPDPVGRLLFNVLAMVAEFEADLIRLRTREGMRVAKAKGKLRGKQPKLNPRQEAHLVELYRSGEHSTAELADLFGVARSTVYRALERAGPRYTAGPPAPEPCGRPRPLTLIEQDSVVPQGAPLRDNRVLVAHASGPAPLRVVCGTACQHALPK
jgi:DNA invertase Pin-like site-specific DNA recombinase